jgi:hypothetical protein
LQQFVLADRRKIGQPEFDDFGEGLTDAAHTKLSALSAGERFAYEFDLGDGWTHLCTVGEERIDPLEQLGITPRQPLPSAPAVVSDFNRPRGVWPVALAMDVRPQA